VRLHALLHRQIYTSLDRLDPAVEAASDLGAKPLQAFRRVVLPLTMPGVWSGCTMVFLLSCGAYVTPQLLGGTSGHMLGNVIAAQFLQTNNWPLGAALSLILVLVVIGLLFVAGRRLWPAAALYGRAPMRMPWPWAAMRPSSTRSSTRRSA
jgi:spermidine/putrescine transport system permease protein